LALIERYVYDCGLSNSIEIQSYRENRLSNFTVVARLASAGFSFSFPSALNSIFLAIFVLLIAGCGSGGGLITVPPKATVTSVAISPGTVTITETGTTQLKATATKSDGSTTDVTSTATWTSSAAAIATVSSTGLVTGVLHGTANSTASTGGQTSPAAVITISPSLTSIAVTPAGASVKVGATQQYTATGTYDDTSTADLTSTVAWSSSSTSLATITASGGLLTAVAAGSVTVSAVLSGVTGTAGVTIVPATVTIKKQVVDQNNVGLNNLAVTFATASGPVYTDPHGNFQAAAIPGSQMLTITNNSQPVLSTMVTVNTDGSLAQYSGPIQVTVTYGGGNETKTPVIGPRAPLSVTPTVPYGGQSVTVAFSDVNATSISVQFTGAGCGNLLSGQLNGTSYSQTANVANEGSCQIVATVQYAAGPQTFQAQFQVRPTSIALPAFSILGAGYVPGDSLHAAVSQTGTLSVTGVTGPGELINGGLARIYVQTTNTATTAGIVSVQVGIHGTPGYFVVPAQLSNGKLYFDLALDQDYFATPATANGRFRTVGQRLARRQSLRPNEDSDTGTLDLDIQTVDSQGNISDPDTTSFPTLQVGSGTLQISLSWGTPDDLDLHVVEPSGNEIYYGARQSPDGGVLDLDSNPACEIDNIDNENVTWPNATPPAGQYIVRTDFYESCSGLSPAYQVTVNNCGNVSQFTGSFTPDQQDFGGAGSGVTVSTFNFTPCNSSEVSGTAMYDDLQATPTGLSTTPVPLPIRYATAEVHRASDDSILTTGSTDAAGNFDLTFTNTGTPGYYVKIVAASTSYVNQEVVDQSANDYFIKSGAYDETVTPMNTGVEIHALVADVAPAFNVWNIGVDGTLSTARWFGSKPTKLTWLYFPGQNPTVCANVSCFSPSNDTIYVLDSATDSDKYDDLVLLHEYGHFVQKYYSADNSPAGTHMLTGQYDPRLGWSEGSATFFALFTRQTSEYIDTSVAAPMGVGLRYDVTIPISSTVATLGTDDGTQTGYLSEIIPTAGMWAMGVTDGNPSGVFTGMGSIKGIPATKTSARDFIGADFVDFLDGWFCTGNDLHTKMQVQINMRLMFPYDYVTLSNSTFCATTFPDLAPGQGVHPDSTPLRPYVRGTPHPRRTSSKMKGRLN